MVVSEKSLQNVLNRLSVLLYRKEKKIEKTAVSVDGAAATEQSFPFVWGESGKRHSFTFSVDELKADDFPLDIFVNAASEKKQSVHADIYLNGKLLYSADSLNLRLRLNSEHFTDGSNSVELIISSGGENGAGLNGPFMFAGIDLLSINEEADELIKKLSVMRDCAYALKKDTYERNAFFELISSAISGIHFSDEEYPLSSGVRKALDFLNKNARKLHENRPKSFIVGEIDAAQAAYYDKDNSLTAALRELANIMYLMKRYHYYFISVNNGGLLYMLKENEPDMYMEIKQRNNEGRLELTGGLWSSCDIDMLSGESLISQIMRTQTFFDEEFSKLPDILRIDDQYNYPSSLPQIMKHASLKYLLITKEDKGGKGEKPFEPESSVWSGADSSTVFAHAAVKPRTEGGGPAGAGNFVRAISDNTRNISNGDFLTILSSSREKISHIEEALEAAHILNEIPFTPGIEYGKIAAFFKKSEKMLSGIAAKAVYADEPPFPHKRRLASPKVNLRGMNSLCEDRLLLYKRLAASAELKKHTGLNGDYADSFEYELFRLQGASGENEDCGIQNAFYDLKKSIDEKIDEIINTVYRGGFEGRSGLLLYNPLQWTRNDIIVFDAEEGAQPSVYLNTSSGELCTLDIVEVLGERKAYLYAENMSPLSFSFFNKVDGVPQKKRMRSFKCKDDLFENDFFKIEFDSAGQICSFVDKRVNRELSSEQDKLNQAHVYEDMGTEFTSYSDAFVYEEKVIALEKYCSFELRSKGENTAVYSRRIKFSNSLVEQDIVLYRDLDRIDIFHNADWKEPLTQLKLFFPVEVHARSMVCERQFYEEELPLSSAFNAGFSNYGVNVRRWADLSEDDYGVSFINMGSGLFSYDNSGLSLCIAAGSSANQRSSLSIYPHIEHVKFSRTVECAEKISLPIAAAAYHEGALLNAESDSLSKAPKNYDFVQIFSNHAVLSQMTRSADSEAVLMRFYQSKNRSEEVSLIFSEDIVRIHETDFYENPIFQSAVKNNRYEFVIKPFEIKTLLIYPRG